MVLEPPRVRSGEYERETIVVYGTLGKPVAGFWAVWRIAPDQSLPRSSQAVVFDGEVPVGRRPWTLHWSAWIKVKRAKCSDDFWRGQPFLFAILQITVMYEIAEFRVATVGDDFLNDFLSHWKIVFPDDFR